MNVPNDRRLARGVMLMSMGTLLHPGMDGLARTLSEGYSPLMIGWVRYLTAGLLLLPVCLARNGRNVFPRTHLGANMLRTSLLVFATLLYLQAIALAPLAGAKAIFLISPILTVPLGVYLLGEAMTWKKAGALLLGCAGALVMLRPGAELAPGLPFALAAGVCYAFYVIASRRISEVNEPLSMVLFQHWFGALLLTPPALWTWKLPLMADLGLFLGMGVISAASYLLTVTALRHGEASMLAPLIYLELIGALAVGWFFFGELPDLTAWTGMACIVAGGLVLIGRRRGPGLTP